MTNNTTKNLNPQNHIGNNNGINLLRKCLEAASLTKNMGDPKMCGGQALWNNLVSPEKTTWHSIQQPSIWKAQRLYSKNDMKRKGPYSLNKVAKTSKTFLGAPTDQYLLAADWKEFELLYKTTIPNLSPEMGDTLCMFGLRLAMTPPKVIFVAPAWI
jgi:hypothetical protein